MQMLTETEFDAFKKDDQKAFKKVFDSCHSALIRYVESLTKISEDAEEIVQEGFVLLYTNKHKLEHAADIYPYLFTIVKRLTISYFRRKVTSSKYLEELKGHWSEQVDTTSSQVTEREIREALQNSIDELPLRQKQVYTMNKLEDKSYQEIADDLGLSRSTVKNQIIAATKIIRLKLSKYHLFIFFCFFH
ncbi:RNA polymerase sigma-70 factor [Sphingobacterium sp. SGG-5]|uniref:RNA polymerase sigma factor n=1 Tax=Sphingobacterium sp. SGG-5 TaxID=2710881 RepID=UPI0013EC2C09|nr:RNA polymerase sigma-70 factor [Sphingobacterium sp. SGG-5]NGM61168.1 RNA polymerase sigma-70 factor [Sphingobacterium sp. SGG-5]